MSETSDLFESSVLSCFNFLVRDYGFRCVEHSASKIRFESERVFIEIYHSCRGNEIGIDVGRRDRSESFSFAMFLRRYFPAIDQALGERLADAPEKVAEVVEGLCNALRIHGQKIIEGDIDLYKEMEKVRWWHFRPEAIQ
jgi:hypothetical protein